MNYEQRLTKAKEAYKKCASNAEKRRLESIFPELKEPDDEKIRKQIISFLKEFEYDNYRNLDFSSWIAWLETHKYSEKDLDEAYKCADKVQYTNGYDDAKKEIEKKLDWSQNDDDMLDSAIYFAHEYDRYELWCWLKSLKQKIGVEDEQKSLIKPKFNVGDWIIFYRDTLRISEIIQESRCYRTISTTGLHNSYDWGLDNIARLWTIADAKDGDVLVADNLIVIFAKSFEDSSMMIHSSYDLINKVFDSGGHLYYTNVRPATVEESAFLLKQATKSQLSYDKQTKSK